ncbi:hypothetical protein HHK36_017296 [Tetracentron sinense]|uniref:NAC domain-containing protein n=1 Tax=Tetracentron sinense TaxID=13715 RepID=A0A834YZH3_TETSI|nr:hypothetical protein HHK36_017296 [Tetracentron sinense]
MFRLMKNSRGEASSIRMRIPLGVRFNPTDEVLVNDYLKNKILNRPLPCDIIKEVNLYHYSPDHLAGSPIDGVIEGFTIAKCALYNVSSKSDAIEVPHHNLKDIFYVVTDDQRFFAAMYKLEGEKEMYFFTQRVRRTQNGTRPNRTAGNGYWKASAGDKAINSQGRVVIGYKMVLNYYNGLHPRKEKSKWIMHEYKCIVARLPPASTRNNNSDDMRLDDWVLCKIYQRGDSDTGGSRREIQVHLLENEILNNPQEVSNIQQCSSMTSMRLESENNQVEPISSEPPHAQLPENNQYHDILNNPQEVFSTDQCSSIMASMGLDHESENQVGPFSSEPPQTLLQFLENNYQYDHDILNNPQLQEVFITDQSSAQPQLQDISNNSDLEPNQLSCLNNIIWEPEPEYDQFELMSSNQNYDFLYMDPLLW